MPDGSSAAKTGDRMLDDAEFYKRNLPTNGMSFGQTTLAGIGKMMTDTARGVGQRVGMVSEEEVEDARRTDEPLMQTGGGNLGYIGSSALAMATPAGPLTRMSAARLGAAAPYAGAAARSGAFAATQPVGQGESLAGNVRDSALMGVGGQSLTNTVNRAAAGAASRLPDASRALAQKADDYGFRLSLPQLSDNVLVRTVNE